MGSYHTGTNVQGHNVQDILYNTSTILLWQLQIFLGKISNPGLCGKTEVASYVHKHEPEDIIN